MGLLRVISKRGDDRVHWNEQDALAGDAEAIGSDSRSRTYLCTRTRQGCDGFSRRNRQAGRATGAV